ncbi:MAG: UDP-glucose/GDP-mannose dehydrogenase family protein [Selenomonadaceae bacterium]|nr:UDP-glucose/GDP-mannose dehydrogenase family protein [Selenomonadaceae bacterium]
MVTVFGLGFVGLTTALGFAHLGYKVYGVDVDAERKKILRAGKLPFLEPHMDKVLAENLGKNFFVTDDVAAAVADSEIIYYCVGTPYGADGSADLKYLFAAVDSTIDAVADDKFRVLVTKSTIPPSTTAEKIIPYVSEKTGGSKNFAVANNPEFLREGHCWEDFLGADRIVIGCDDERARAILVKLYAPMNIPIKCVTPSTGEFIKYLSNTLLATLISFSNEMAQIADTIGGIEVAEAFRILHMDKRWNGCNMTSYVYPGCGYGGYCLPKDTNAMFAQSRAKGFEPQILKNVIATNDNRPKNIARQIVKNLDKNSTVGILGLSFKPLSDDVRDTPALHIIREILDAGFKKIVAYDPAANEEFARRYPDLPVKILNSAREVYDAANVLAIVTAWDEFRGVPNFGDKKIVDCRYML